MMELEGVTGARDTASAASGSSSSAAQGSWASASAPSAVQPTPTAGSKAAGPTAQPDPSVTHVVQQGETLDALSARYGAPTSKILSANPSVTDPNLIHTGQALTIPLSTPGAAVPDVHVVSSGETMSGIASHYKTSVYRLATANGISDPNQIEAGQKLWVPGQPPAAPSSRTAPAHSGTPPAPTGAKPPNPADQAHTIVAAAQRQTDPVKSVQALNTGYTGATPAVRSAVLADPGAKAILHNAAAWANQPLANTNGAIFPEAKTLGALQRLDHVTNGLNKDLAGAVAEQAVGGYQAFVKQPDNGGTLVGMEGMTSLMNIAGRISGSAGGDRAIAGFVATGAWNSDAVLNSIAAGASPAYAIAMGKSLQASGQSPSIVVGIINDGIAQRDLPRIGNGGSPQPTLDVARQMQAAGLDASGVENVARQGVNAFRGKTKDDVEALASHDAELSWLVQNDGAGMTPEQLNQAVASYRQGKGAEWNQQEAALRQKVASDGSTLVNQMLALNQAAPELKGATAATDKTLREITNDPAANIAISTALQTDPKLAAVGTSGKIADLFAFTRVGDIGRRLTNVLAANYVRNHVQNLVQNIKWDDPASIKQAEQAVGSLHEAGFAKLLGVSPAESKTAVDELQQTVARIAADPSQSDVELANLDNRLEHDASLMRAFNRTTPAGQILRSVAVGFAGVSLLNSANNASANPNVQNELTLMLNSAGFAQKSADLLVGLGAVNEEGLIGKFGGGWTLVRNATASDLISGLSAVLDGISAVRSGFGLGVPQNTITAGLSGLSAVGGAMTVLPALGASAWLGPIGIGVAAVGVLGSLGYQEYTNAHQFQGASQSFLRSAGYDPAAASALSKRDGIISGASGAAQMPFLAKYAEMKHLTPTQMQAWVNGLSPHQVGQLAACLLQTAGDSHGNPAQFTNGPPQTAVIGDSGGAAIITLANTLGAFESNLAASGVPRP